LISEVNITNVKGLSSHKWTALFRIVERQAVRKQDRETQRSAESRTHFRSIS
jgi:hypothetical protein